MKYLDDKRFWQVFAEISAKIFVFIQICFMKIFLLLFLIYKSRFTSVPVPNSWEMLGMIDKKSKRSYKIVEIRFFLLYLLDIGRIRIHTK